MQQVIYRIMLIVLIILLLACQKTNMAPAVPAVAAITIVNAIPNTINNVIPVINTTQTIMWFNNAFNIGYGGFYEYSPYGGNDTVYVVQANTDDTLNIGQKKPGQMFYNVLPLHPGNIYSLFLCGSDTTSPDFLFTTDTLPFHSSLDSVMGIRFVNLSTGSNPISINLEGNPNGSEVPSLAYKGITGFKTYANNSSTVDYMFVIRDAITGDSLTQFDFLNSGSSNNGFGLIDPSCCQNSGTLLTFKNITIGFIGQPGITTTTVPQSTILIDNY
jgi:hypothetical protein